MLRYLLSISFSVIAQLLKLVHKNANTYSNASFNYIDCRCCADLVVAITRMSDIIFILCCNDASFAVSLSTITPSEMTVYTRARTGLLEQSSGVSITLMLDKLCTWLCRSCKQCTPNTNLLLTPILSLSIMSYLRLKELLSDWSHTGVFSSTYNTPIYC